MTISGSAIVAGIAGRPVAHSLSPLLHNLWIEALNLDAAYVPFAPQLDDFERFVRGLRGGAIRGFNVTAPFKERALALADVTDAAARDSGSANLLLFHETGEIEARSTDGAGLLAAFAEQAPHLDLTAGPVVILGAGGAARAAAAALVEAGAPKIAILNRTAARAEELVFALKADSLSAHGLSEAEALFRTAQVVVNAAAGGPAPPLDTLPEGAAVMDMTYRPLETGLLRAAKARGLTPVDGLAMLINQAKPSFEAFFGQAPPDLDVRSAAIAAMDAPRLQASA
ncbi:MAG TPA: shikimate dehydrogenase [Caulobacteraceae bacterium]|jgi:shikimate dehydrogenase